MPMNINGLSMTGTSGLGLAGGVNLDTNGILNVPSQPLMTATPATSSTGVSQYPYQFTGIYLNVGSCWTSNTTWTAPVAGIYIVCYNGIANGSGNISDRTAVLTVYLGMVKNGVLYTFGCNSSTDAWNSVNHWVTISLAAGDTVAMALNVAPSPVGNGTGFYQNNHGNLVITLIG